VVEQPVEGLGRRIGREGVEAHALPERSLQFGENEHHLERCSAEADEILVRAGAKTQRPLERFQDSIEPRSRLPVRRRGTRSQ
jgi:hypothetical protein